MTAIPLQRPAAGAGPVVERDGARRSGADPVTPLVRRAAEGDQAAWNALVERYTNLVWSVARSYRLSGSDAADVVQTTWLRLVENLGSVQDPERLPGWLATTARRECLRVLRRGGRELVGVVEDTGFDVVDELAPALDAAMLQDERDAALWTCFAQLSERCQRLLRVLMAAEPPAYAQVSEALGMPIGSIGPTRMRCLDRLREITSAAGYDFATALEGSRP